jgi:hypothetical protein
MMSSFLWTLLGWGDNGVMREIWNGAWTMLALSMFVSLAMILLYQVHQVGSIRRSYRDLVCQVCVAEMIVLLASGGRAAYIWTQLHCQNRYADCDWVLNYDWLMSLAGLTFFVGGCCTVRVLSPPRFQPWVWMGAGLFALIVPTAYYVALHGFSPLQ